MYRRVIQITAKQSPNVRLALAQLAAGIEPTHEEITPGVLSYREYVKRRATWDIVRQTIGLDAEFYEGAESLLFPPEWLNRAHDIARRLPKNRRGKALGVDTGEGAANTAWAVSDDLGLIELISKRTPDTSIITGETIALMKRHNLNPEAVFFDRGGGGKWAADLLRKQGYNVKTVSFGPSPVDPRRGLTPFGERLERVEDKSTYLSRRVEMYDGLSQRLDPTGPGFGIPGEGKAYQELRRQLAVLKRAYDEHGRMVLPPKQKKPGSTIQSLQEILGCSPDEADAAVLGVYGLTAKKLAKVRAF